MLTSRHAYAAGATMITLATAIEGGITPTLVVAGCALILYSICEWVAAN